MRPQDVHAPRGVWQLIDVLYSGTDGDSPWSLALGRWNGEPCLGIRWDGTGDNKGMPLSSGHPVWFILPSMFYPPVLALVPEEKLTFVRHILGLDKTGKAA